MEDTYLYKDEYDNDCIFFRKKYHDLVLAIITDFFEEPLPNNGFQKGFINFLNTLDDYHAVYHITGEMPFYWAICIIEDRHTSNHLIKNKTNEAYMEWSQRYHIENDIITFIKEGINEETYVFNDHGGGKGIFLRGRYYEFVCSLVTDFFEKPLEYNLANARFINHLNALFDNGSAEYISKFLAQPPYDWALSIIENKETANTLNPEQLASYTEFLEAFYRKNGMTAFTIPQNG